MAKKRVSNMASGYLERLTDLSVGVSIVVRAGFPFAIFIIMLGR